MQGNYGSVNSNRMIDNGRMILYTECREIVLCMQPFKINRARERIVFLI